MKYIVISIFLLSALISCQSTREKETSIVTNQQSETSSSLVKYAKGFSIEAHDNYKILTVKNPWIGESKAYQYILYENEKPAGFDDAVFIKIPITSIACMSLTHVAFIEKLNQTNSIVALSGCDYVKSEKINSLIKSGSIKEIGQEQSINYEMLVDNSPDILMAYGIDASSTNYIHKIETLGLNVALNAEYMETHPLGKAEWIKFIAAFYEKDVLADSIFNAIEEEYLLLVKIAKKAENKPTVFTGMPWNGAWYVPGAKSYQAQLFNDAGANYLWKEGNTEKSSLVKAKEVIINEAYDADFWLNQDSYKSISSIVAFDEKFKGFKAIKQQQLYNNDKRLNSTGGNDYWESGVVNPQLILKDLINIFHPELVENDLYYYRKLK